MEVEETTNANEFTTSDGFCYLIEESKNVRIIGYIGTEKEFVIPATVIWNEVEYPVTHIGSCAFKNCSSLEKIAISDGVKSIGAYAFLGCSHLKSVELPEEIETIGVGAFEDCNNLIVIYISGYITSVVANILKEASRDLKICLKS